MRMERLGYHQKENIKRCNLEGREKIPSYETSRKKVQFTAIKKIPKKVKIDFTHRRGPIRFSAIKKTPKKIRVNFRHTESV